MNEVLLFGDAVVDSSLQFRRLCVFATQRLLDGRCAPKLFINEKCPTIFAARSVDGGTNGFAPTTDSAALSIVSAAPSIGNNNYDLHVLVNVIGRLLTER